MLRSYSGERRGGLSTGPKTAEGIARIRRAVTKHGPYSAAPIPSEVPTPHREHGLRTVEVEHRDAHKPDTFIRELSDFGSRRTTVNTPSATAKRRDCDSPSVIAKDGWRFHHIGIPTNVARPGETHLPWLNVHVSGFASSPYGIQWMRFDKDAPYPDAVKSLPHVAFEVDDLARALEGKEILVEPNCPSPGVTVAMIIDDGAPIELLEFRSIPDHQGR